MLVKIYDRKTGTHLATVYGAKRVEKIIGTNGTEYFVLTLLEKGLLYTMFGNSAYNYLVRTNETQSVRTLQYDQFKLEME